MYSKENETNKRKRKTPWSRKIKPHKPNKKATHCFSWNITAKTQTFHTHFMCAVAHHSSLKNAQAIYKWVSKHTFQSNDLFNLFMGISIPTTWHFAKITVTMPTMTISSSSYMLHIYRRYFDKEFSFRRHSNARNVKDIKEEHSKFKKK